MAKSLVCNECKALLRNVAEAQSHNEITGHTNFAESEDAIKVVVCTTCGKPCRTDAERQLHTRYTKHTEFVDKTDDTPVLNTEAEMKDAKAAMDADDDIVRVAMGKKPKAQQAVTGDPSEMVPAQVDENLLKELEAMGFNKQRATRGIHFSHAMGVEAAVNWIMEHDGDADVDEPLLLPKGHVPAVQLTPEEARKKAEDLVKRAKVRREAEEKAAEREREKDRVRHGKELQLAKQKEDEGNLRRMLEERKREKDDEAKAKARIREKLEEDKKERRRKLGLPEELTPEEKAREAAKLEAERVKAEERKKIFAPPVKPVTAADKLRAILVAAKKANPGQDEAFKTACGILLKYLGNVVNQPDEEKFRTIKLSNAAFQSKVAPFSGREFLELCGFKPSGEVLVMSREQVNVDQLNAAGIELNGALSNPFFGVL